MSISGYEIKDAARILSDAIEAHGKSVVRAAEIKAKAKLQAADINYRGYTLR